MPLPTPSIEWRYSVNISCSEADAEACRQRLLFEISQRLQGFGSWTDRNGNTATVTSPWAPVAGSDSASAEPINMWTGRTDLTWAQGGADHSWHVFRHANYFGSGNPLELLLDCTQVDGAQNNAALGVFLSRSGFTGLTSVANRPTSTDEHEILMEDGTADAEGWQGADTNDVAHRSARLHVMMSDDGTHFRAFICRAGLCVARWDLFPVANPPTGWTQPYMVQILSLNALAEHNTWATAYQDSPRSRYRGNDAVVGDFECRASMPYGGNPLEPLIDRPANTFDGSYALRPIELDGVVGVNNTLAVIPDCWWGNSSQITGNHAPDDGTRRYVHFGNQLVPWNTSQALTS